MLTEIPIIDVETTFADFVEKYGGVVSDRLGSSPDKPKNADYIFHNARVIAELKLLKENPTQNRDFIKSRAKKTREWLQKGYIRQAELNRVTKINQLPDKCYRDIPGKLEPVEAFREEIAQGGTKPDGSLPRGTHMKSDRLLNPATGYSGNTAE